MSLALAADAALALLVLALGVWTVAVRDSYAAVLGFVAYGLVLALLWVRLGSADVALTEAALGSGLTGFLLLGAAARLPRLPSVPPPGPAVRLAAAVLCTAVAAGIASVLLLLPDPAPTLAPEAAAALPATGLGNPVTAVLMAYRAVDTLFEAAVLVPALIGVWSLARDADWGGRPGPLAPMRPSGALALLAQVLPPFGILVGVHLVWTGADDPGGKFQGATVLAAMWVLVLVAGLREPPVLSAGWLRWLIAIGPLFFMGVGLAGLWLADAFLAYPAGWAKPLILAIEGPLTLSVALTLGLLLAGPPGHARRSGVGP